MLRGLMPCAHSGKTALPPMQPDSQFLFRGTASQKGRHLFVSPENSSMRQLYYGRIILDREVPRVSFESGAREVALLVMRGSCEVVARGQKIALGRYDALYVPRDSSVEVTSTAGVDIVECAANVEGDYPLQLIRYADVEKDSKLRFPTGGDTSRRTINILIGSNVKAGRVLAGFTCSAPGNWTSWPPHEHSEMLEEAYA